MWFCPKCTEENEGNFLTCWNCGFERDGIDKESGSIITNLEEKINEVVEGIQGENQRDKVAEEYPALIILTKLIVFGGWVGAILTTIFGLVVANESYGILTFLVAIVISFFIVTCSYAIGELIKLLINIEINTRK